MKAGRLLLFLGPIVIPPGLFPVHSGLENAFHCWQILALAFKQIFYNRFSLKSLGESLSLSGAMKQ